MKAVILGCGQVGSELAVRLAAAGLEVTVLDRGEDAFRQLPEDFAGTTVRGDGMDEESLKQAGIEKAQVFVAATAEDNYNLMAGQLVRAKFGVAKIIVRVYDPDKAALFAGLNIETYCPTKETATAMERMILAGGK